MFRRLAVQLRTLAPARSASKATRFAVGSSRAPDNVLRSFPIFSRHFTTESGNVTKRVEDVMPIATGHEREELEAELKGKDVLEINYPSGPFGTKEAPAVIKSYYDKRIVGCPGVEGDEHDVVWFWLEKGKPHECPVCSQYFVVSTGGTEVTSIDWQCGLHTEYGLDYHWYALRVMFNLSNCMRNQQSTSGSLVLVIHPCQLLLFFFTILTRVIGKPGRGGKAERVSILLGLFYLG
ncbi:hypothetical protein Pfo_012018 [Paulownia fortunei]|nr:hypothetical protein Pfo_012018 [Paulownia fortunei]